MFPSHRRGLGHSRNYVNGWPKPGNHPHNLARSLFPLVSLATVVPVLFIGLAGQKSMATLLVGGFFLGIGGTAFAGGVPFVTAWFPPERRVSRSASSG